MPMLAYCWKLSKESFRLLQLVFTCHGHKASRTPGCLLFPMVRQWLAPLVIEKDLKPSVNSNSMDEDVVLSFSDSGPLRRVRDPGALESEGLTLRSSSVLKGRSPHMSQISDPQALVKSSAVTAQGQAVLSQSESKSAITHAVSAASADSSHVYVERQWMYGVYHCSVSLIHAYVQRQWMYSTMRSTWIALHLDNNVNHLNVERYQASTDRLWSTTLTKE